MIVLLSPIINKLTDASTCSTQGYIAGFFNAVDLLPTQYVGKSNGAEIFYSLVPDPNATFSCAHDRPRSSSSRRRRSSTSSST